MLDFDEIMIDIICCVLSVIYNGSCLGHSVICDSYLLGVFV